MQNKKMQLKILKDLKMKCNSVEIRNLSPKIAERSDDLPTLKSLHRPRCTQR